MLQAASGQGAFVPLALSRQFHQPLRQLRSGHLGGDRHAAGQKISLPDKIERPCQQPGQLGIGRIVWHLPRTYCRSPDKRYKEAAPHPIFKFSADSLPLFATTSKLTLAPSLRLLRPAFSTAEICTNTSLPPACGWIKP